MTTGISFHYYTLPTENWDKKGAATGFPESEWMSTMAGTLKMDGFIKENSAIMDKHDPEKKIGFLVDEWGTWYDVEPGTNAGFLFQNNTLRDAVLAAVNFNIFHAHAERVTMTNIAQMVNVLQAMIITDKDKMLLTPTYYAYQMYIPFQDATSLPISLGNNVEYKLGDKAIPSVSASAAKAKDGKVYVALVNMNPNQSTEVSLDVKGSNVTGASGKILTSDKMDAHNTWTAPQAIKPAPYSAKAANGKLNLSLPAISVVVVALEG